MPRNAPRIQFEDESTSSESDDDRRRGRGRDRDRDRGRDRDRDRDRDRLSSRYSSGSDSQPEVYLSREGSVHIKGSPRGGRGRGGDRKYEEEEIKGWFSAHCFRGGIARTRYRITNAALYQEDYPCVQSSNDRALTLSLSPPMLTCGRCCRQGLAMLRKGAAYPMGARIAVPASHSPALA
eukprot:COSAG04_NODE_403_length_14894_cov_26.107198_4_plen_180_part_00